MSHSMLIQQPPPPPILHGINAFCSNSRDRSNDSEEPDGSRGLDKKPVKHRRNYQACEPCRERKVKCDLGDVDHPGEPPCKKCARESKTCYFNETRKKNAAPSERSQGPSPKRARQDSGSMRTVPTLPLSPTAGKNGFNVPTGNPFSPPRGLPPSSPASIGSTPPHFNITSQPRMPNHIPRSSNVYATQPNNMPQAYNHGTSGPFKNGDSDDHVVMPQANSLAESFTNTTDNMSVLVRAATTTESGANSSEHRQRSRALTGSSGAIDLRSLPPQVARARLQAREVWKNMRFVRAGWFSADEALQYVDYFYTHLAPMTPVIIQDFKDPSTHKRLLTEEPVLALAILAVTSRYCELQTDAKVSRGYYIHEKLWDSLRKIVQRLLWGQEQFGGGFTGAGMIPTQQQFTGQITWKGSLRTLGTIEALLLLTDWQPRALHFPPGDDENKLVGAGFALYEEEKSQSAIETGNLPYSTWLEPAWRSDRMSWMLLGLAQSLSFELGVFDKRHEACGGHHGPRSDCMRRRRIRRLVITYVSQISGRIGIQATLTPDQDKDPKGPDTNEPLDVMQRLWFDIASIMFDANRDIFPSRETTAAMVENGLYKAAIAKLQPRLQDWLKQFQKIENRLEPAMRAVLRMEYEYSRLYINSLGLQKVVGQMTAQKKSSSRGPSIQLAPVYDDNKVYIDEVRDAARQILESSCFGLGNLRALGYSPVRTFLRTLSGLMFSLKLLSLGSEERIVRSTFKLLREMTNRMRDQVVDDVHLSLPTARLIQALMEDVHSSMIRIPKPGSRGQSRHMSPQQTNGNPPNTATSCSVSDQQSPDPLARVPFADYENQTFMPPPNFDVAGNFDANMGFDNVDPALYTSSEDWMTLPIDGLMGLSDNTVNQGYGGIGPTFGDRDMLSLITGTHLDQNQIPSGMPASFSVFDSGF